MKWRIRFTTLNFLCNAQTVFRKSIPRRASIAKKSTIVSLLIALMPGLSSTIKAQKGAGDVIYEPTPEAAVEEMLRMAKVGKNDFVIDLGSGDGRIVITAAKKFGARG